MCGIAGFIQSTTTPDPRGSLARMLSRIAHRGPDGQGEWHGEAHADTRPWHVALGHRRLAIIDLATGAQPMDNEDGRVVITFNGEIYNFQSLRPELERQGHRFKTRSDTETIIHHFEQHGADGVRALNGMFAFAIWDAGAQRLVLARDRVGIKPLYYAELAGGGIAFASELAAVLAHGGVDRALSTEGVASFFFSDYVHPPHTIVRGVHKLPPGHTLVWERGRLGQPRAFWQVPSTATPPREDDQALADRLWHDLGRAVDSQLISDVPVGVFLSGGIDSSCIATLAAARAPGRMKAFSIGFDTPTFDESAHARLVASRLGVEHITETLSENNLLEVLDPALDQLDEPLADPSYLPTYLLSRLAARHVKVVLGGDGGDELWAGYPTYRAHRYAALYGQLPRWVRSRVVAPLVDCLPASHGYQSLEWKLRRFTHRFDEDQIRRHLRWMSNLDLPDLGAAMGAAHGLVPATMQASMHTSLHTGLLAGDDWLNRILALDFTTYMPGSVLTKVDRASMAHGLEVRPPLLDNQLVDWAFSLPSRYKLRGQRGKFLLKLAARGKLPDQIIDRPKKGFAIPLALWLAGPLRARIDKVLAGSPLWDLGILHRATFVSWHGQHSQRRQDRSKPLWALLVLDHWFRSQQTAGGTAT